MTPAYTATVCASCTTHTPDITAPDWLWVTTDTTPRARLQLVFCSPGCATDWAAR